MLSSFAVPACALGLAAMMLSPEPPHRRDASKGAARSRVDHPVLIERQDSDHRIAVGNDGLYHVDAATSHGHARFIVDSGANITLLTRADARRLGLRQQGPIHRGTLLTAGGRVGMSLVTVTDFHVAGRSFHNVRVGIPDHGPGTSLLGQDLLRRFRHVSIDGGIMTVS